MSEGFCQYLSERVTRFSYSRRRPDHKMVWDDIQEVSFEKDSFVAAFRKDVKTPSAAAGAKKTVDVMASSRPKKKTVLEAKRSQQVGSALH